MELWKRRKTHPLKASTVKIEGVQRDEPYSRHHYSFMSDKKGILQNEFITGGGSLLQLWDTEDSWIIVFVELP